MKFPNSSPVGRMIDMGDMKLHKFNIYMKPNYNTKTGTSAQI